MRKNFGVNPFMYPMPVLMIAAYDKEKNVDIMNAAWGGILGNDKIAMCITPTHKTVKNIMETKEFTVSMGTEDTTAACDYAGIVSGNDEPNKMKKTGFTVTASENVNAPLINELPMTLECKMYSYDEDSHIMIGQIVNICADEKILSSEGNIDPGKLKPIVYDPVNHDYLSLGTKVGNAFADGEKLK